MASRLSQFECSKTIRDLFKLAFGAKDVRFGGWVSYLSENEPEVEENESIEERHLKANCSHWSFRLLVNIIQLFPLTEGSLRATNFRDQPHYLVRLTRLILSFRVVKVIHMAFLTYFAIKMIIITLLLDRRDYISKFTANGHNDLHRPSFRLNDRCTIPMPTNNLTLGIPKIEELRSELIWLDEMLMKLGAIWISQHGTSTIFWVASFSATIIYLIVPKIVLNYKVFTIDTLNFIHDPIGERLKFRLEVDNLIKELQNSLGRYTRSKDMMRYNGRNQLKLRLKSEQENQKSLKALLRGRIEKTLKPAIMSARYHTSVVIIFTFSSVALAMTLIGFVFTAGLGTGYSEMRDRFMYRHELARCRLLNPEAIPIFGDLARIPERPLGEKEIAAYENLGSGTVFTWLCLLFSSEFSELYGTSQIVLLHEWAIFSSTAIIWCSVHTSLFFVASLERIIWMTEIQGGFGKITKISKALALSLKHRECPDLMGETITRSLMSNRVSPLRLNGNLEEAKIRCPPSNWGEHSFWMSKWKESLIMSYLSFELFNRHNREYRRYTNFALSLIVTFSLIFTLHFYMQMVALRLKNILPMTLVLIAEVIASNQYLLFGALVLARVTKIMRLMMNLVGNCTEIVTINDDLQQFFALNLIRRQILEDIETRVIYGISCFGVVADYQFLMKVNFYIIVISSLILRVGA